MKTIITKMSIISLIVLMMASCKKDPEMPSEIVKNIKTNEVTDVTAVSAVVSAYVGADCDERGVCWGESENPTIDDFYVSNGRGKGDYTCSLTNLTPNKKYYCKAYGKCGTKYVYSQQTKNFTTKDGLPTIVTGTVSDITATSAKCSGRVTDGGGLDVTDKGLCWAKHSNPTTDDMKVSKGAGLGEFTVEMTGLEIDERYYVRAYSVNTKETKYGNEREFKTLDGDSNIYTGTISDITVNSAVCIGSKVTDGGGLDVTDKGLCWAKHSNPTTDDMKVSKGAGLGEFTVEMTGLEIDERYYVRAYSVNAKETKYGNEREFTTKDGIAVVTTSFVTNIMMATATCGGEVTDDGGLPVTERGVCWSTSQNPTVAGSHTTDGSGTGSFTSSITDLTENTTYYVRAYATNSKGTSYGELKIFTTQSGGGGDHEYVDLGLPSGLLWATCNVGADSPEDYGWYFMWGSVTEGGDSYCDWAEYPGNGGSSDYNSSAIAAWDATHLTNNVLNPEVDAAHANLGGDWRMPTNAEFQELYDNTTCTWTTEDGVAGRKFTSKTDSSKYIFLPAAGRRKGTDVGYAGSGGYWSSSLLSSSPCNAYNMYLDAGNMYPQGDDNRWVGYTVRPVRAAR